MRLEHLCEAVSQYPELRQLSFELITRFVRLCCIAKGFLLLHQKDSRHPPQELPGKVVDVLANALQLELVTITTCWNALHNAVWDLETVTPTADEIEVYIKYGLPVGIASHDLYPPTRVCLLFGCENYRDNDEVSTLTKPLTHPASLFTLSNGALPIHSTSLYCEKCYRRYYLNYFVDKTSSQRVYYDGIPAIIEASPHAFIVTPLLEMFANAKMLGWLSSLNCARIYNESLANPNAYIVNNPLAFSSVRPSEVDRTSPDWRWSLFLKKEDVLDSFFLYSLLLDAAERVTCLMLSGDGKLQRTRLDPALRTRNKHTEGIGQEAYTHACDLCFFLFEDSNGNLFKLWFAVCDGKTLGFRCCAVHDCKAPLGTNRARFCPSHKHLSSQCAVVGCTYGRASGFRTCTNDQHRALETAYFKRGKALFQLRDKAKQAGLSLPSDTTAEFDMQVDDDEEVIVESQGPRSDINATEECGGKSEDGNRKLRAYFGCRRTHNEQIIMRPCGVITSRASLYGSEAVSAVHKFAKATFPTPESTPEFFIFDNNCQLSKHQAAIGDNHFISTAMPVDVFHFNCKHSDKDSFCQQNCNPALFPELVKNGRWCINMSICEQTNNWLGGYQSILRDMEGVRYNFYLDEMIKRRNRWTIAKLVRKGHSPWSVPIESMIPQPIART